MSIYDELVQDWGKWWETNTKYDQDSMTFIKSFATTFKEYIGAPDTYQDLQTGRLAPSVALVAMGQYDDGNPKFESPGVGDILTKDMGLWNTGITVTVVRQGGPPSYITSNFWVRFGLRPEGCGMLIWPEKTELVFDARNPATWNQAFDYMVERIRRSATEKPWDAPENVQIGFVHHR